MDSQCRSWTQTKSQQRKQQESRCKNKLIRRTLYSDKTSQVSALKWFKNKYQSYTAGQYKMSWSSYTEIYISARNIYWNKAYLYQKFFWSFKEKDKPLYIQVRPNTVECSKFKQNFLCLIYWRVMFKAHFSSINLSIRTRNCSSKTSEGTCFSLLIVLCCFKKPASFQDTQGDS
jgi:hypothetical protein